MPFLKKYKITILATIVGLVIHFIYPKFNLVMLFGLILANVISINLKLKE